jgi:hypothetical protein
MHNNSTTDSIVWFNCFVSLLWIEFVFFGIYDPPKVLVFGHHVLRFLIPASGTVNTKKPMVLQFQNLSSTQWFDQKISSPEMKIWTL